MAQQTIDIGSAPNDGTGDPIRDAFDKCNDNFTELYNGLAGLLDLKGSTDCSANPNYPAASKGDAYVVSVAGKIGGASGEVVEAGDVYFATADNAGGTEASVGTSWTVIQGNVVAGAGGVAVEDAGAPVAAATTLNFTGSGVSATDQGGGVVDVDIPGGSAGTAGLIGIQTITATGAGTYTPTAGTQSVVIELIGGGGGGGGCPQPGGTDASMGCGGGGGAFLRKRLTASFSGASYSVGAKGTGGAAGANAGTAGGNTTFTDTAGSPTTYTAAGGSAGSAGPDDVAPNMGARALGGAATNGDINISGGASLSGFALAAGEVVGGQGGISQYSAGGRPGLVNSANSSSAGSSADGKGGGGGGAAAGGTGAAVAGGNGSDGMIIIWEYS